MTRQVIPVELWRTSTYSDANGGQCVEVADTSGCTAVRDTKYRNQAVLMFPSREWRAFVTELKADGLD